MIASFGKWKKNSFKHLTVKVEFIVATLWAWLSQTTNYITGTSAYSQTNYHDTWHPQ